MLSIKLESKFGKRDEKQFDSSATLLLMNYIQIYAMRVKHLKFNFRVHIYIVSYVTPL